MIIFDKLSKVFKDVRAITDLSMEVRDKEVFGLLGPNGAGKTTSVLILCSVLKPTSGTIKVNGIDVSKESQKARGQLGVAFQEPVLDLRLTVEQNLDFHAAACGMIREHRKEKIADVLRYLDLWESRNQKAAKLSGGMKKKLEDAKVFIQKPPIAVFDEPTAYLDVTSRLRVWKRIAELKEEGSIVVLATNMMDEADKLCDRLAILSRGKLVAAGTPAGLKDEIPKGDVIEIRVGGKIEIAKQAIEKIPDVKEVVSLSPSNTIRVYVARAELNLPRIMEVLSEQGAKVESVDVKEPSLDDVFLHYTGETL